VKAQNALSKTAKTDKLMHIELLRGFAALAVAWYHFTLGQPGFLQDGLLKASGSYGRLGVEVFFVISGFVIPYSMWRSNYKLPYWPTFLAKRLLRLYPPYILSFMFVLILLYASAIAPGFRGTAPMITPMNLLLEMIYLKDFFGQPWLNPIAWTLGIEIQYYILVALIYPLISSRARRVNFSTLIVLTLAPLLIAQTNLYHTRLVFHWLHLFLLGIVAFQYQVGLLGKRSAAGWLLIVTLISYMYFGELAVSLVGNVTAVILAFVEINVNAIILFFGNISYSLYLLHIPIGGRVINLGTRVAHSWSLQLITLFLAFVLSICAAYSFYHWVEKPAQRWSSKLKYI